MNVTLTNGEIEVAVARAFGPRILFYGPRGGANMLGEAREAAIESKYGTWRPVGGHRLWCAPESSESYAPDDEPVECDVRGAHAMTVTQPVDAAGLHKELQITLDHAGSGVTIHHRIVNRGAVACEVAPWALTIMRPDGVALIPQEPYRAHADEKLPARPMVLWPYTDISDPRWTIGPRFIRFTPDPARTTPQKIGVLNKQRWCAYHAGGDLFTKRFPFNEHTRYPDYCCNNELFSAGSFIEIESLGPLVTLGRGEDTELVERWHLHRDVSIGSSDESIAQAIEPLLMRDERAV